MSDECSRIADEYLRKISDAIKRKVDYCSILDEAIRQLKAKSCPIDLISEFEKFYKKVCDVY